MSWVIIEKETGNAVCELFESNSIRRLNTKKYEAVDAGEYLKKLNLSLNNGNTYRDKNEQGLLK